MTQPNSARTVYRPEPVELPQPPRSEPIEAVLFDLFQTLIRPPMRAEWLDAGWHKLGRPGTPEQAWGAEEFARRLAVMSTMWERAAERYPNTSWDLSPEAHLEAFLAISTEDAGLDPEYARVLHGSIIEACVLYDDTLGCVRTLRSRGVKVGVVSNVGIAVSDGLARLGLGALLDAEILSYQVGHVKPEAEIFQAGLDALGVPAARTLMVGDTWDADNGGAQLGIRTLLLPPVPGTVRGLDDVLRLVLG